MKQLVKCKSLIAIFQNNKLLLDGPHTVSFDIGDNKPFHISIEQCEVRKITITSAEEVSIFDLHTVFSRIERLLMLFDGTFIPLAELQLTESSSTSEDNVLHSCKEHFMKSRLSYFSSADFCSYKVNRLLAFNSIFIRELFCKWEQLLEELDMVHQIYLYSLSDSGITVDVKCAFLIELAEPLIEIVKKHTNFSPH